MRKHIVLILIAIAFPVSAGLLALAMFLFPDTAEEYGYQYFVAVGIINIPVFTGTGMLLSTL